MAQNQQSLGPTKGSVNNGSFNGPGTSTGTQDSANKPAASLGSSSSAFQKAPTVGPQVGTGGVNTGSIDPPPLGVPDPGGYTPPPEQQWPKPPPVSTGSPWQWPPVSQFGQYNRPPVVGPPKRLPLNPNWYKLGR